MATDVGGVSEAVGDCGIVCKPRDAKSLADGVIRLLQDDKLRDRLGKKARERVLEHYTITESVENYYKIYKRFHEQERVPASASIELHPVIKLMDDLEAYGGGI